MLKQLRKLLLALEASALAMLLISCTATPVKQDYNPLSGPSGSIKILCLDKNGTLIDCPPQTEEEMDCHGNMDEDPSNPKKEL